MPLTLDTIMAAGEAAIVAVNDVVADVKSGIAVGGGAMAEGVAIVELLMADEKFRTDLVALVNALKAL